VSDPFLNLERGRTAQAAALLRENPTLFGEVASKLKQENITSPVFSHLPAVRAMGGAASINDMVILPSSDVTIKATAESLFKRIGPTHTMFIRGGAVMEIVEHNGVFSLEIISPAAARSRFESYATLFAYRVGRGGKEELRPTVIPQEMAAALLETLEARIFLPEITGLINCPVIACIEGEVQIASKGFHLATGLFVTDGQQPKEIGLPKAKSALRELVDGFDFQSPSDRSRALASFITPALKLGGHLHSNVPADVAEADQSQAGKTYRQKLVAALYNDRPALVTCRSGGVGSVDESLNAQLMAGHPFIQLDNFRGKFNSPHIEAFLTAEKSFPVRVPHTREVLIDPSQFFVMLTSNGVETTRDFANRASIVRIRKRQGYVFRQHPEGDLLDHVRAHQQHYLGAVFAIVREWIEQGRPLSSETRHDFREWVQTLDWIVQNILGEAPLMDGHQAAQERVSDPNLTFLRKLALALADQNRLGEELKASELYEICVNADVVVPGLREANEEKGKLKVGSAMAPLFKTCTRVSMDGFTVTRREEDIERDDGGGRFPSKTYQFERVAP
jgi:hypothetical protein